MWRLMLILCGYLNKYLICADILWPLVRTFTRIFARIFVRMMRIGGDIGVDFEVEIDLDIGVDIIINIGGYVGVLWTNKFGICGYY